jgi:predicted nuclease with RNAse H fold
MSDCYLGFDPTNSERRPTAWALLDDQARIVEQGCAGSNAELLALAERLQPAVVAIDSPLFLPLGLASLDDPAAARGLPTGRCCERELKSLGIGCFYTTPSSIIKPMVNRCIALRLELEQRRITTIEVFPYASKVRLFGRPIPPKTRPEGRLWLQSAVATLIPGLPAEPALSHDALDALIAAYTGLCYARGAAKGVGDPAEGLLWLPK